MPVALERRLIPRSSSRGAATRRSSSAPRRPCAAPAGRACEDHADGGIERCLNTIPFPVLKSPLPSPPPDKGRQQHGFAAHLGRDFVIADPADGFDAHRPRNWRRYAAPLRPGAGHPKLDGRTRLAVTGVGRARRKSVRFCRAGFGASRYGRRACHADCAIGAAEREI